MRSLALLIAVSILGILAAQPPVESPSATPIPNVRTPPDMPEALQDQGKVGPGTSKPDNPNYKKEPSPSGKRKQVPNPLDAPKDTVKPGTLYTPKE